MWRCYTLSTVIKNVFAKANFKKTNTMEKGTVKFFNETKGFGFIKADSGQEVFVHVSGLKSKIQENDVVSFDVQEGKKGLNAVNVTLA